MSKVASITISTKSRQRSPSSDSSPTSPIIYKVGVTGDIQHGANQITSSESDEDKNVGGRRRSSGSSPERRLSSQRNYETYDQERGLIHAGKSGKMSSKQRTLEQELNTTDPSFVASSDDALGSSDDGLEDSPIPRKSSETYYMVKYKDDSEEPVSGTVYDKKNVEPPRSKSQPAGNRVQSATGKLLDNYVKDQSFDNLSDGDNFEKPKTSVSVLKAAYSQKAVQSKPIERYKVDEELEQIRFTMQNRGMMEREEDSEVDRNQVEPEVMCRKPLSSIKDKFLAAACGKKVESSSDSEDDKEKETSTKEEIVASSQPVVDIRKHWHEKGKWEDRNKELDEEVITPLHSVVEMKKRWQEGKVWSCDEVTKEDVIYPELKVVHMTKKWQEERTFSIDKDQKDDLIALEQSVLDIKQNWPVLHSFDEENEEDIEMVVTPPIRVTEMKEKWQQGAQEIEVEKELDEEVITPLHSVVEMKKRWQEGKVWSCDEVTKEDVIYPELKVVHMTKKWQEERTFSIDKDQKDDLIALEQSVLDIKQNWPVLHSFDEENEEDIEMVVTPPIRVTEMKEKWQQGAQEIEVEKIDAFDDIDASQVGSARSAFKQMENQREVISTVNKPRVNKISDPNTIMQERRHKTYGDESQVDGVIRHEGQDELATLEMDVSQIKAAKNTFQVSDSSKQDETKQVRRPSMKLIKQEDVSKTMTEHRRKVSAEDFDDYAEHIKPNGTTQHLINGDAE